MAGRQKFSLSNPPIPPRINLNFACSNTLPSQQLDNPQHITKLFTFILFCKIFDKSEEMSRHTKMKEVINQGMEEGDYDDYSDG